MSDLAFLTFLLLPLVGASGLADEGFLIVGKGSFPCGVLGIWEPGVGALFI
ncbi:hypothetical protein JCM15765_13020 [Paradesulfitobacterium aromaticivorans]